VTRIVGIGGCSYCGSTMLDRMLGMLPGVVALGETHWILDARDQKGERRRWLCAQHGSDCPAFIPSALGVLQRRGADGHWWDRLAAVVGQPAALVSSDKNTSQWRRLGLPDAFVVPYRSPASMVASYEKRGHDVPASAGFIVSTWRWLVETGRPIAPLDMDRLADDGEAAMREACARLGLPYSDACLRPWDNDGCSFGGNWGYRDRGFDRCFRRSSDVVVPGTEAEVETVRQGLVEFLGAVG